MGWLRGLPVVCAEEEELLTLLMWMHQPRREGEPPWAPCIQDAARPPPDSAPAASTG